MSVACFIIIEKFNVLTLSKNEVGKLSGTQIKMFVCRQHRIIVIIEGTSDPRDVFGFFYLCKKLIDFIYIVFYYFNI